MNLKLIISIICLYRVRILFSKIPIFGILTKYINVWKNVSLMLNIVQNFFNLLGMRYINSILKKETSTIDTDSNFL